VRRDRAWIALPLSLAGMLSAASSEVATPCVPGEPSRFDYLVFASMADSQHPMSMIGYRPQDQKKPCNSNSTSC
jgi:hypothetical protein